MSKKENIQKYYRVKHAKAKEEDKTPWARAYSSRHRDNRTERPPYSQEDFKKHLESQFVFGEIGWFNYGSEWSVDHIVPLHKGGKDELENLRPLSLLEQAQWRKQ